jgi:hypothetical protein
MIDRWKMYSFTLAEIIVVCSLFAIMVIWIIFAINRTFVFMDNTRLAVRASNLARGWVEMVYNLRDSNWRKYSSQRDQYRLNLWTWSDRIGAWIYTINEAKNSSGDSYIYLSWLVVSSVTWFYTIEWFFSDAFSWARESAKLDFTWTYLYYSWSANSSISSLATWNLADLLHVDWLEFYRIMRVYGVECKIPSCSKDSDPRELRFCVKVFYENVQWKHATELCSLMTNFME